MALKHRMEPLAASMAGALVLAAVGSAEETAPGSGILRRPDTSSFHFASTFQGEDALRTGEWKLSEDRKYDDQESRVRVEPCSLEGSVFAADFGLLLDESHKHYAVGATLPKPFDNTGKDLVIQYEVQVRDGVKCGGAYVKLLRGSAGEDMAVLNNESPYSVMFGPDKCFRDSNKVHFIFQHQNPVTKEWEEKHFTDAPKIKDDTGFHVYTLHVKTDSTFDVYIDAAVASSGNLLENMSPAVFPPKEVDDPDEVQPEDWVTEEKMDDPSAVKPDDWDEDAPRKIVDEAAEMPEGWLENEEDVIMDTSSSMPDDWDEEEDGEWEPLAILNPACEDVPGCGPWKKPLINNPDYMGPWKAPQIDNPDYKGPWSPRKIANPEYFEDAEPSRMAPITGLAVEIWSVDGGVWLDNFVVGDDISAALKFAEETWRPKFEAYEAISAAQKEAKKLEKEKEKASMKKERDAVALPLTLTSTSRFLVDKARPVLPAAAGPVLDTIEQNPITFISTVLAGVLAVLLLMMRKARKSPPRRGGAAANLPGSSSREEDEQGDGNEEEREVQEEEDEEEEEEEEEDEEEEQEEEEITTKENGVEGESTAAAPISSAT